MSHNHNKASNYVTVRIQKINSHKVMKKIMNADTENRGKPIVDNNSSAQSQSTNSSSSNTKSSNSINNSLNVILPQYTVIDQKLFDQNGKRTVQSSPSKSHRKLSEDSGFSANKYKNVSENLNCFVVVLIVKS